MRPPVLAVGDGALGFWAALREVFPQTREQRDWVHKVTNVLDALPNSAQHRLGAGPGMATLRFRGQRRERSSNPRGHPHIAFDVFEPRSRAVRPCVRAGPKKQSGGVTGTLLAPASVVAPSSSGPRAPASADLRTVLITDIVDSTQKQAELGDAGWRDLLMAHRYLVRKSLMRWQGVENDTAGDGFYATFVDPNSAVHCALEVTRPTQLPLEVRAGLHLGTCELADDKCTGLTVSIGARVAALAAAGEVLLTAAVHAAASGEDVRFEERGSHVLKGVPGRWPIYRAISGTDSSPPAWVHAPARPKAIKARPAPATGEHHAAWLGVRADSG